jgi:hypothetical protein
MFKKKAAVKLSTILFRYIGNWLLVIAVYFLDRQPTEKYDTCLISTGCVTHSAQLVPKTCHVEIYNL